ncbi:hypothetical protein [Nonomuraea fuscirosea]|uniref:hypothetical protein n=1 Tax=Nonomuraea fuscirosea TaxID=1291556 RepID=UPI0034210F74
MAGGSGAAGERPAATRARTVGAVSAAKRSTVRASRAIRMKTLTPWSRASSASSSGARSRSRLSRRRMAAGERPASAAASSMTALPAPSSAKDR